MPGGLRLRPVVTVDYEFYDQQDVESARELVAALRRGEKPLPTRGAPLTDFKGISRQLAGFSQYEDPYEMAAALDAPSARADARRAEAGRGARRVGRHARNAAAVRHPSSSGRPGAAEAAGAESAQRGAPEPAGRRSPTAGGTDTPPGPSRAPVVRARRPGDPVPPTSWEGLTLPLTPVLTTRWGAEKSWRLSTYERPRGLLRPADGAVDAPDELVTLVKDSGLRGRGGAGFPTGMKWSFIPQPKPGETPTGPAAMPKYLVVNADEGEPGTCKDLPLMMADPHSLVEGVIISAYAIRSHFAVIYVRGEAVHAHRRLMAAVEEAYAAGYLGTNILGSGYDLELVVHAGAGAYICGEETALLDSLEGYRGQPRLKPPFPAVAGLYGAPTVINNVETLASVPFVVRGGADWFKEFGPEKSPGPKIYSLSGRVVRPGQYEAPMGTTMRELLEMAGGVRPGHELKFWTPGGSSTPYFTAEHLDVPLDFDSVAAAGSMLGTTALMVFDETDSIVEATLRFTEFYAHESCGKCTPCREGTYWLVQILERIVHGRGTAQDLDLLLDTCDNILGRSFCALGDGATSCIASSLKYFKDDYVALLPPEEQARLGRTLRIEPVGVAS